MSVETERGEADGLEQRPPAHEPAPAERASGLPRWAPAAGAAAAGVAWAVLRPASPTGVAAVVDLLVLPALLVLWVGLLAGRPSLPFARLASYFGLGAVGATVAVLVAERLLRVAGVGAVQAVGPVLEVAAVCGPAVALALAAGDRPVRPVDPALAGFATGLGFLVVAAALATAARHVAPDYLTPFVAGLFRVPTSAGEPAVVFAGLPLAGAFVGLATGLALRWGRAPAAGAAVLAAALVAFDDGLFQWRLRAFVASEPAVASGPVALVQRLTLRGWLAPVLLVAGLALLRLRARGAPAPEAEPAPAPAGALGRVGLAAAVSVPVAAVVTLLARNASLGFLSQRLVALVVALAGLVWAGLSLATVDDGDEDGASTLSVAAFLCAGVGVLWALLPTTHVPRPAHGGLLVDAALGWAVSVGNLGVVLGLGGFAAPPGRVRRGSRIVLGREHGSRGFAGVGRLRLPAPAGGATSWSRLERRARRGRRRRGDAGVRERTAAGTRLVTVTIEPARARPTGRLEFTGRTVKEAMTAALAAVGDLAHSSLQLVDEGSAGGKAGPPRPARVRVAETGDDDELLLPPARDSIVRSAPVTVVVEVVADEDVERPEVVDVELRGAGRSTVLRCAWEESAGGRDRYRSNPYSVTRGEDAEPGTVEAPAVPLRVAGGGRLEAEYRKERAAVTVYDTWADQVAGVNRELFEVTRDNHRRVLDELEELAGLEEAGRSDPRVRHRIDQLRTRLAHVDEGLRMLDLDGDADAKAFRSTAVLAMAMSLDARFDDRRTADAVLESASVALAEHRRAVAADPHADAAAGAFRTFLSGTAVGRLWRDGAWSPADVSRTLGWYRLADVHDDLS